MLFSFNRLFGIISSHKATFKEIEDCEAKPWPVSVANKMTQEGVCSDYLNVWQEVFSDKETYVQSSHLNTGIIFQKFFYLQLSIEGYNIISCFIYSSFHKRKDNERRQLLM